MNFAKVVGTAIISRKTKNLLGNKFLILEYLDIDSVGTSEYVVAVDTVKAGIGDLVSFISSKEASFSLDQSFAPVDAAVIGIIDRVYLG
jgi:microcompartment protein CcmK/EutM